MGGILNVGVLINCSSPSPLIENVLCREILVAAKSWKTFVQEQFICNTILGGPRQAVVRLFQYVFCIAMMFLGAVSNMLVDCNIIKQL